MRLSTALPIAVSFATAAALSVVAAVFSVDMIENASRRGVRSALANEGLTWATVHAEGLQVFLTGVAPTEAERFKAITAAGHVVDAARVIDNMQIEATADIGPPRFSVEILRNDAGVQLIGLVPEDTDRDRVLEKLEGLDGKPQVTDFLETAAYDMPKNWARSVNFALFALEQFPRAKVSVETGRVSITAMSDSVAARDEVERTLIREAPKGVELVLEISAPRPVITPFTLRFLIDDSGPRFDACSADTEEARSRILDAATKAGLKSTANCTIGLGVPTPRWAEAVETAINGLTRLGGGTVTFSDADIALVAAVGTDQGLFDRVVGELETSLPDIFALHSTLPIPDEDTGEQPEFTATLSPEGLLQMRGRLRDDLTRNMTESYAAARFGSESTDMAARLDEDLPSNWSIRAMAGLDALSNLRNGVLTMTADTLSLSGQTGDETASDRISRLLASKLDQSDHFTIDVTYLEELDPVAQLPTPEECAASIKTVLEEQKISFEPGSGTLDDNAGPVIDKIAEILGECTGIRLEIQGHTDSQGREEMNQALSQTRAQSVLNALQDRRILTSGFVAVGYGETQPIADNETEEGREANRRIEFVIAQPDEESETEATQTETDAQDGDEPAPAQSENSTEAVPAEENSDDQN